MDTVASSVTNKMNLPERLNLGGRLKRAWGRVKGWRGNHANLEDRVVEWDPRIHGACGGSFFPEGSEGRGAPGAVKKTLDGGTDFQYAGGEEGTARAAVHGGGGPKSWKHRNLRFGGGAARKQTRRWYDEVHQIEQLSQASSSSSSRLSLLVSPHSSPSRRALTFSPDEENQNNGTNANAGQQEHVVPVGRVQDEGGDHAEEQHLRPGAGPNKHKMSPSPDVMKYADRRSGRTTFWAGGREMPPPIAGGEEQNRKGGTSGHDNRTGERCGGKGEWEWDGVGSSCLSGRVIIFTRKS